MRHLPRSSFRASAAGVRPQFLPPLSPPSAERRAGVFSVLLVLLLLLLVPFASRRCRGCGWLRGPREALRHLPRPPLRVHPIAAREPHPLERHPRPVPSPGDGPPSRGVGGSGGAAGVARRREFRRRGRGRLAGLCSRRGAVLFGIVVVAVLVVVVVLLFLSRKAQRMGLPRKVRECAWSALCLVANPRLLWQRRRNSVGDFGQGRPPPAAGDGRCRRRRR